MKKLGILVTVLTLGLTTLKAQEITKKHEFRLGVSDGILTSTIFSIADNLTTGLINGILTPEQKEEVQNSGITLNGGYRYNLNNRFTVGGDLAFQRISSYTLDKPTQKRENEYTTNLISILPTAEFSYYRNNLINLYGSASAGMSLMNEKLQNGANSKTSVIFSGQVNPIGIKVGKSIGGFAEVGFGVKGIATAGVYYRF